MKLLGSWVVGEKLLSFLLDALPVGLGGAGNDSITPLSCCLRSEGVWMKRAKRLRCC
jgi:hypothetical protein